MHTPVLLQEAIDQLNVKEKGKYIDATFGEGGHSFEIIKRGGVVLAIDWDKENVKRKLESRIWPYLPAGRNLEFSNKIKLVWGNYADIETITKENDFYPVEGVLFDLGLSMEQLAHSGRGFSFKNLDEPLDMRISSELVETAADIVNNLSRQNLYELFSRYSQEVNSLALSESIYRQRMKTRIKNVGDLVSAISGLPMAASTRESVVRRVFQALRMQVNHELENIKSGILGVSRLVKPGGRIVVISFHQTEDRTVKLLARKLGLETKVMKKKWADTQKFERSAKVRVIYIKNEITN